MAEIDVPGFAHGELLGRGGFGSVYRAADAQHGRDVAIKILDGSLGDDERRRFDRERAAMGALGSHPNIVPVYGSGYTDDGRAYIVMEYAAGDSLRRRLDEESRLEWREAATIMAAIARGVEAAHSAGILHRDIKPDNILIDGYGNPKLADFGIATVVSGATTTKGASTTLAHAAPELLEGQPAAAGMDVYALGSTLHNLLSGMPPFARPEDELAAPMLRRILAEPPPDLRPLGVPDSVARVVEQALEKQPGDRQRAAALFAEQLDSAVEAAASGEVPTTAATAGGAAPTVDVASHVAGLESPPLSDADVLSPAPAVSGGADRGSRRGLFIGVAAALVLLVGAAAFALTRGGDDDALTEVAGPSVVTRPDDSSELDRLSSEEVSVEITCPNTIPFGETSICGIDSVGATEGSWTIPGFTNGQVTLETVPGANPIFIEPTNESMIGNTFTITVSVIAPDGTEATNTSSFRVEAIEDSTTTSTTAAPTTTTSTTAAPTTAAPTTAAPTTAAPTTAAPTTAAPTTAAPTTAAPTTAAPTTAAPAPSVSISCPAQIALNTSITCDIQSANAVSGSWSLPGFFGGTLTMTVPGSNPIFINPTNPDVVGRTFTISATVQSADGRSASASRSFTVTG